MCLTPDQSKRPDIVGLASDLSDLLLQRLDAVRFSQIATEKKLERERKRTQRQYMENARNMASFHNRFVASQDRYDKLVNLAGSGGSTALRVRLLLKLWRVIGSDCGGDLVISGAKVK